MKKVFFTLSALFLACSACSHDYVAQCQEMYSKINEMPCINISNQFDLDVYCPETYNTSGYKYDSFFACVEKNITCDGDKLVNNVASCMNLN